MKIIGLLEAFDRNGAPLARMPITRWPVSIGRALSSDLVLDDPHVAPEHLRIDRPVGARGAVSVEVLETANGAALGRKRFGSGDRFDWPGGGALDIGRVRLGLRLADAPIAAELPLPQFPWARLVVTVLAVIGTFAHSLGMSWLQAADPSKFVQTMPTLMLLLVLSLGVWSGLWAVANKVFAGHPQFWRHVRIACLTYLGVAAVEGAANLIAFSLSLESFSRFDHLLGGIVIAAGIYAHLVALLPRRRRILAWATAAVVVLGIPALLGAQWLDKKRLSSELYMSSLFPPSLRIAPAVPVPQYMQESQKLRERLDRRLHDEEDAAAAESDAADDDDGE